MSFCLDANDPARCDFELAAPDALHLALASNRGFSLATFDTRLAEAAAMRGVRAVALG